MIRTTGIINTPIGGRKDPNIYAINRDSMQLVDPAVNQSTAYQKTLLSYDPKMPVIKRMVDNQIDQTQVFNTKKRRVGNIGNTPISKIGLGQAVQGINNTGGNAPTNISGMGTNEQIIKEEGPGEPPEDIDMNYYDRWSGHDFSAPRTSISTIITESFADNESLPVSSVVSRSSGVPSTTSGTTGAYEFESGSSYQPSESSYESFHTAGRGSNVFNPGQTGPSGLEPQAGNLNPQPGVFIPNPTSNTTTPVGPGPVPGVYNPMISNVPLLEPPADIISYPTPTSLTGTNLASNPSRVTPMVQDSSARLLNDERVQNMIQNAEDTYTRLSDRLVGMTRPTADMLTAFTNMLSDFVPSSLLTFHSQASGIISARYFLEGNMVEGDTGLLRALFGHYYHRPNPNNLEVVEETPIRPVHVGSVRVRLPGIMQQIRETGFRNYINTILLQVANLTRQTRQIGVQQVGSRQSDNAQIQFRARQDALQQAQVEFHARRGIRAGRPPEINTTTFASSQPLPHYNDQGAGGPSVPSYNQVVQGRRNPPTRTARNPAIVEAPTSSSPDTPPPPFTGRPPTAPAA